MKKMLTRFGTGLFAACAVGFAATAASAETNITDKDDPSQLLAFADAAAAQGKSLAAKGKISGAQYSKYAANLERYRNWYNCVGEKTSWRQGAPVQLRLSASDFDFLSVDLLPGGDIMTVPAVVPGTQTTVRIGYSSKNPLDSGMAAYYLLGVYTNGIVLIAPGTGYWRALDKPTLEALVASAAGAGGIDEVNNQQFNEILVSIFKELNLNRPPWGNPDLPWPYIVAAAIALLVIVLALLLLRKRPAVKTCPKCGSALLPNGSCPICDTPPPPPPPPPVCSKCGSPLLPDGHCPKCDRGDPPPPPVVCPNCGAPFKDGQPTCDCTIPFCPKCNSIMKNGECPNCGKTRYCPSCGSEIVDHCCPNGCTIVFCPNCDEIVGKDGICPNGCNAKALRLGWSGSSKPTLTPWKLEVVAPAKHVSETCELPFEVVIGRSASERKTTETYIQLHFENKRVASGCSRRYVKLVTDPATKEVTVELLSTTGRAVVDGKPLSSAGDKAPLAENGTLELTNAGYKLRLVRA